MSAPAPLSRPGAWHQEVALMQSKRIVAARKKWPPVPNGTRFDRWTVIGVSEKTSPLGRLYCVRCDCGTVRDLLITALRAGASRSCGCLQKEAAALVALRCVTHGLANRHPLYATWKTMNQRCRNPKNPKYPSYGGRGIRICDRWSGRDGFSNFIADMGERPEGRSLDRIDVDGNYEPGNCRWATATEQARNTRRAKAQRLAAS